MQVFLVNLLRCPVTKSKLTIKIIRKVKKELDFEHQNNQWQIVKELTIN